MSLFFSRLIVTGQTEEAETPEGSAVDWQIFLLLLVEKQRESRAHKSEPP